ncbi:MAG TPA: hypothetical protein V6D06_00260 [Trichocoleus sp.]
MPSRRCASVAALLGSSLTLIAAQPSVCLPPPEDIPEEVLRTEIITEARSPIDGELLSAAEYAQLQAQLQNPNDRETASPNVREIVFLLQLRRGLRTFIPIIP